MLPMITNEINDDEMNSLSQLSPEDSEGYDQFLALLDGTSYEGGNLGMSVELNSFGFIQVKIN
jgi:hypothetical protein